MKTDGNATPKKLSRLLLTLPRSGYNPKCCLGNDRTFLDTSGTHRRTFQRRQTHPLQYGSGQLQTLYRAHEDQ